LTRPIRLDDTPWLCAESTAHPVAEFESGSLIEQDGSTRNLVRPSTTHALPPPTSLARPAPASRPSPCGVNAAELSVLTLGQDHRYVAKYSQPVQVRIGDVPTSLQPGRSAVSPGPPGPVCWPACRAGWWSCETAGAGRRQAELAHQRPQFRADPFPAADLRRVQPPIPAGAIGLDLQLERLPAVRGRAGRQGAPFVVAGSGHPTGRSARWWEHHPLGRRTRRR
jgi:hypothetical protein